MERNISLHGALHWCGYRGLILPLAGASAISTYSFVTKGQVSLPLALVTFLFIYASYMIDHVSEIGGIDGTLPSARTLVLSRQRLQVPLAGTAFGAALILTFHFADWAAAAFLLLFPLSVTIYTLPLFGKSVTGSSGGRRIKDVPYLKSIYTSFFWGVLMVFAAVFLRVENRAHLIFFFTFMWMRMFIGTVFCDLKDIERDKAEGCRTFPIILGVPRTLGILHAINILSFLLLAAFVAARLLPLWLLPLTVIGFYTGLLLQKAARSGADIGFLCDVAMDGEFVFWLPCAALGILAQ